MKSIFTFVALLSMAQVCCGTDRQSQLDDIREATFRFLFGKNASSLQQNAKVYFLTIGNLSKTQSQDPDEAFMKRFADHQPRVARRSDAKESPDGVTDKITGERGLIFNVGEIQWISDREVQVSGGYFEAGLSASGNTFYLRKKNGKWEVQREKMHWISWKLSNPHEPDADFG